MLVFKKKSLTEFSIKGIDLCSNFVFRKALLIYSSLNNLFTESMKKTLLLIVCSLISLSNLNAQCTAGVTANTTSLVTVSGTAWQTVAIANGAKSFVEFAATTGNTYVFTLNSALGGSCSFDEQLTITTNAGAVDGGVFATNNVNASTTAGAEMFYWSPNSNGNYRIVVSKTGCVNTTAASTLAYTSFSATTNFAIWTGTASTTWTTTANWGRRAAAGYPTATTTPTITDNVFINTGNVNQPNTGDASVYCNDLTAQANTTLTLNHTTNSLQVYGNFTMNGVLNHIGYVYIYFNGVSKTLGGTGNFYGGTVCPIRFVQGSSYTLGTLTGNFLRVSHCYMDWSSGAGGTLSIGSNTLSTHFFFQYGTFNQNTGTLMISGPNNVLKTYAPTFTWASVDGTNPYFIGSRFNAGTGTTYYNSGDFTNSDNFTLNDQTVRSGSITPVSYYNLKIRTNNGQTVTIGDAATVFTVTNQLEIYNPGTAGGVATTATDFALNGTYLLGNSGNALTLNQAHRTARSSAGTGVFTMGNVSGHNVNVTYAHATNWAISLGNAGATTPLTFYGTVTYNSASAQKVMSNTYNNLVISNTATRSLTANTIVNGNLTINAGTLDAVSGSNYNLNLRGDFTNYATFTPQSNTVTFDGTIAQNINNFSTPTYTANVTGSIAIPDGNPAGGVAAGNTAPTAATLSGKGASMSITVPAGSYTTLNSITLSAAHTWNADLDIYLVSPDNTVLVISTDNGGNGDGYNNVTFSDAGSTVPPTANTTFTNVTYKPEGVTFASYAGLFPGTWKIYILDNTSVDTGTLTSFAISLSSAATSTVLNLYNFVIDNASGTSNGVTTNNNISVNSAANTTLTNGVLKLNSNTLILNNTAATAISAGSNSTYIQSETNAAINPSIIQWKMGATMGAHVYPFGVAGSYIPFTFDKTTAGAADISVSTRATTSSDNTPWAGLSSVATVTNMNSAALGGANGSIPSVIDRWWDITTSAAVTGNLSFVYRGSENTTTTAPTGSFAAQHWNGAAWDAQVGSGAGVTSGTGTVTVTGANTFSPWILSSTLAQLPVELISFTADCENNNTKLNWSTATEKDNNYFIVEKSEDGINYKAIAQVEGQGNSSQIKKYNYTDKTERSEVNYYRLKQTDYNGAFEYSSVVSISKKCSNDNTFSSFGLYPNPNSGSVLTVNYTVEKNEKAVVKFTTALGQLYMQKSILLNGGNNTDVINIDGIAPGVYFVEIESSQIKAKPVKFIKE